MDGVSRTVDAGAGAPSSPSSPAAMAPASSSGLSRGSMPDHASSGMPAAAVMAATSLDMRSP